jgi:hypothetical protein
MSNDSLKKKIDSLSTSKFKLSDLQSDKEGLRALAAERFMRKIRNKEAYAAKQRSHHHPPKEVEIPISQSTTEKLRERCFPRLLRLATRILWFVFVWGTRSHS